MTWWTRSFCAVVWACVTPRTSWTGRQSTPKTRRGPVLAPPLLLLAMLAVDEAALLMLLALVVLAVDEAALLMLLAIGQRFYRTLI